MENAIVLFSCNEWKEHASAKVIGVFNDEVKLKEKIWKMFLNSEIEWNDNSIEELKNDAKEEFELNYDNEENSCCDISKEINSIFDESKENIYREIHESSIYEINSKATYIIIEKFLMNEIC